MSTIGFIGTGHITAAMVAGMCAAPAVPAHIFIGPRNASKAADLARRYTQVTVAADNQSVVDASDWLVLAVRPQVAHAVVAELAFKPGQRILSLIAPVEDQWLDAAVAPGRLAARIFVMPSVAARIGPTLIFPHDVEVAALLAPLGVPIPAQDRREFLALWSLTALLAPYYGFLASAAEWAAGNGARAQSATAFARASFHALAASADQPGAAPPAELAQAAQTPGGLNEQAVRELANANWFGAIGPALDGILKRLQRGS